MGNTDRRRPICPASIHRMLAPNHAVGNVDIFLLGKVAQIIRRKETANDGFWTIPCADEIRDDVQGLTRFAVDPLTWQIQSRKISRENRKPHLRAFDDIQLHIS